MAYGSGSSSTKGANRVTFKGFSSRAENQNFKVYDFECVKQDLINRLSVRKGERVENPDFGTIIYDVLFEPLTPALKEVRSRVRQDGTYPILKPSAKPMDIMQNHGC